MIILASSSPRRIELLKDSGIDFKVISSDVTEELDLDLKPYENAMNLAIKKANAVLKNNPEDTIIAADTMVVLKGVIFGKPKDEEDAFEMLSKLSNNNHQVITAVAIMNKEKEDVFYCESVVKIKDLTEEEIRNYVATGEPFGKAGGYAIQGIGKEIVETYEGDFWNIMGLPLKEVLKKLASFE